MTSIRNFKLSVTLAPRNNKDLAFEATDLQEVCNFCYSSYIVRRKSTKLRIRKKSIFRLWSGGSSLWTLEVIHAKLFRKL